MLKLVKTIITLPPKIKVSILRCNNIQTYFLYNNFFYYKLARIEKKKHQVINPQTNSIVWDELIKTPLKQLGNNHLMLFLFSWNHYYFQRFKFIGKGYRMVLKRKKKYIKFFFGFSHPTMLFFKNLRLKKTHKYRFCVLKNNQKKLISLSNLVKKIKPINMYTKRGLRNSRQTILKRKGKKNTTF